MTVPDGGPPQNPLGLPNMTTIDTTKKGEDVKMTPEEMQRFRKCMDDPKFVELWKEYADEISDPKHLAEQEEYLKQVEREANEKGDYSFTFAFPKPCFCVLLKKTGKETVYINICDSEKVDEPREETTGDKMASNFSVPVSIGKKRDDMVDGKPVVVYDAAFHPKSTFLARQSDKFTDFLVDIAVNNINESKPHCEGLSAKLSNEYTRVREPAAIGNIPAQTMRVAAVKGKEGELVFDLPRRGEKPDDKAFKEARPGDAGFGDRLAAGMGDGAAKQRLAQRKREEREKAEAERKLKEQKEKEAAQEAARKEKERKQKEKENAKAFAQNLQGAFASKEQKPAPPPPPVPAGSVQPKFTIVHQGEIDLSDNWESQEFHCPAAKLPRNLVLRTVLPGVRKAAEIELDIDPKCVSLRCPQQSLALNAPLPHKVNPDRASAKFDKAKAQLTLTLPVVAEKSQLQLEHEEQRRRKMEEFRQIAQEQAEEEERQKRAEAEEKAAKRSAEEEEERRRREAEESERREVEEAMERAVAEERLRREAEQRAREEEERRKAEEALRRKEAELRQRLGEIEAAFAMLEDREVEARKEAEREEGRAFRKFVRDLEAARVAERMAEISRQRLRDVPLSNRYIFEMD